MKITKSQFVQLIKESYQKRMLSEAGNDQGDNLDKGDLSTDTLAVLNQINNRIEGKTEWLQFAVICLEFLMEYKLEGATDADLQEASQKAGGKNGNRLYALLKIIAQDQIKKETEKGQEQEQDQSPGNRSDDIQEESMSSAYPQKGSMSSVQRSGEQEMARGKLEAVANSEKASDDDKRRATDMLAKDKVSVKAAIRLYNKVIDPEGEETF